MKKLYLIKVLSLPIIFLTAVHFPMAQCATGYSSATANWDQLDYLTQNGSYASFVTTAMMQTQNFTLGTNRFSIVLPTASMTTNGENASNTAEGGSFGSGQDVEYNGNGSITITLKSLNEWKAFLKFTGGE